MRHLHVVESGGVDNTPTPAVDEDRKQEILSEVIRALDSAVDQLGDLDPWKWACVGIRRRMALTIATSLDDVVQAFEPHRPPVAAPPLPDLSQGTSAG